MCFCVLEEEEDLKVHSFMYFPDCVERLAFSDGTLVVQRLQDSFIFNI